MADISPQYIETNYTPVGMDVNPEDSGFDVNDAPSTNFTEVKDSQDDSQNWSSVVDDSGTKPEDNATAGAVVGTNLTDSNYNILNDTDVMNIINMDYGETINGATLPVAVYQNTSDNEVYTCDADDSDKLKFVGFAIENKTDGESGKVQVAGRVSGFSGLSEGVNYFVQDDGTIGTSKGTYAVLVGRAVSATEIKIISENDEGSNIEFIVSDNLRASDDSEEGASGASYIELKSITIKRGGDVRVKFDMKQSSGGNTAYGRIYINDIAVGTERTNLTTSYETYTEDISDISAYSEIQIYAKIGGGGASYIKNFRLYWDKISISGDYTVN